jgi:GT2 family glycosyltransferase
MVQHLLEQVLACPEAGRIIVTYNISELCATFSDGRVEVTANSTSKGFGANHNAAFLRCRESYLCALNPDIELEGDPFPALFDSLKSDSAGLVAPIPQGVSQRPRDRALH